MRRPAFSLPKECEVKRLLSSSVSNTHRDNHIIGQDRGVDKEEMASDEDYMAFLDKANRDPNEGAVEEESNGGGGKVELKATDKGARVPQTLKKATEDAFYVSDADEPFVPVYLKYSGKGLPDEGTFLLSIFNTDTYLGTEMLIIRFS